MSTTQKAIGGTLLILAGLLLGAFLSLGGKTLGASVNRYEAGIWQFGNGIYAGLSQQLSIDNAGNVSTSGTLSVTGTTTVNTLVRGGTVTATSTTATSFTLASSDIIGNAELDVTPNTGALTYTFPASSTLASMIPTTGQRTALFVYNATGTANTPIKFVSGTGVTLFTATSSGMTGTGVCQINTGRYGILEFLRQSSSSIAAFCSLFQ